MKNFLNVLTAIGGILVVSSVMAMPGSSQTPSAMDESTSMDPMNYGHHITCPVGQVEKAVYSWSKRSHQWVVTGYTCEEDIFRHH